MTSDEIAFNRPFTTGAELGYIADALSRGHVSGDGHYTRAATALISTLVGVPDVLLTTSCTHALEMAALLLNLSPGDEVIMPSFTFVSTANAFALRGALPVFVDIRPDTLNIDERHIEAAITARTKAIVVVHYAGVACEMEEISAIARRHNVSIIEDNAHGFGGTYKGTPLGTMSDLATLSFHETKNIHCGEGGALLINKPEYGERAEIIREKGTNRSRFFRNQVDRYTWVGVGSSYLPSDMLAAFLTAQLEDFDAIQSRRLSIWTRYKSDLTPLAEAAGFQLPTVHEHNRHPAHLFWLLAPDLETRQRFIGYLGDHGIRAVFHYVPLHSSEHGRKYGDRNLPVTDSVSDRLVRLPLYAGLRPDELDRIVETSLKFDQ
jgi:dTDP-4-amino-4,6-dideoxygalactose transaminase